MGVNDDGDAVGAEDGHERADGGVGADGLESAGHEVAHRAVERAALARVVGITAVDVDGEEDVALVDDAGDSSLVVLDDHLADAVHAHALDDVADRVGLAEGVVLVEVVAAGDEVTEVVGLLALDEAVVDHPEVVEHLGEVLGSGVADEGDDVHRPLLLGGDLAAIGERRREDAAGAGAREHALFGEQLASGEEGLGVGDGDGFVHELEIADVRDEVLAHALDEP